MIRRLLTVVALLFALLLALASPVWAINVTPDVVWTGTDVFQTTTVNVPIPAGITSGMLLMVASTWSNSNATVSLAGGTSGVTWTDFGKLGAGISKHAFWKIADASDASDSSGGGQHWTFTCLDGFNEQWAGAGWAGVNTVTPFATGPSLQAVSSTTFSWTSQTSPGASQVWVGLLMIENNSVSMTQPGPPPTNQAQSTACCYFGPGVVYSTSVGAGATGTFSGGTIHSGFEWGSIAFILNPSGGGGCTATASLALRGVGGCGG